MLKVGGVLAKSTKPGYGSIKIGHDTWIGNGCKIYKGVTVPPYSVVGADTILTKTVTDETHTLICNERKSVVKVHGVFRNASDDSIEY